MGETGWVLLAVGVVVIIILMKGQGSQPASIVVQRTAEPVGNPGKGAFANPPGNQTSWIQDASAGVSLAKDVYGFMRDTGIFES